MGSIRGWEGLNVRINLFLPNRANLMFYGNLDNWE
jgi:hypothetical protein